MELDRFENKVAVPEEEDPSMGEVGVKGDWSVETDDTWGTGCGDEDEEEVIRSWRPRVTGEGVDEGVSGGEIIPAPTLDCCCCCWY